MGQSGSAKRPKRTHRRTHQTENRSYVLKAYKNKHRENDEDLRQYCRRFLVTANALIDKIDAVTRALWSVYLCSFGLFSLATLEIVEYPHTWFPSSRSRKVFGLTRAVISSEHSYRPAQHSLISENVSFFPSVIGVVRVTCNDCFKIAWPSRHERKYDQTQLSAALVITTAL